MKRTQLTLGAIFLTVLALIGCNSSGSSPDSTNPASDGTTPGLQRSNSFVNFESGQVRPLALSDDGARLYATNTPNGTLDILAVTQDGLTLETSVRVGIDPVAVALFGNEQAWVVNHLSDSISIVDIQATPPRVVDTLLVGDEPRDIVFAGTDNKLAFITTAHRGQNGPDDTPIDAELSTPSVGRADVWVFDATMRGNTIGGDPVSVLSMFGDTPRALTVSADGNTVFAAVMHSGNRTTTVGENFIGKPGPVQSSDGFTQPDTGLIVKFDGLNWHDATNSANDANNTPYNSLVKFSLPDYDVFAFSATESPEVIDKFSGVGTTLFNMATHPLNDTIYVTNTDANNLTRFEGPGTSGSTVKGNIGASRITVLKGSDVLTRDLNKHLDHTQPLATDQQRELSVAQPLGMALSGDGNQLYLASFGTDKIAVYQTEDLENDSFEVSGDEQISVSGGGPTAMVLDEARDRIYAYTRFNNGLSIVDTQSKNEISNLELVNPEPSDIIEGRRHLYNAATHSSHGDASCASCHVFGDVDAMAWDLGNPDETVAANPNRFVNLFLTPEESPMFHPMKGPMTTQSLRGMSNAGPMHWRGDRTGKNAVEGESLEHAAFVEFNDAFVELLGRDAQLSDTEMSAFADFALTIKYPPNPIRALDNSLSESQASGRRIYFEEETTGEQFTCNDCHVLDPLNGHFGTDGKSSIEGDDVSQEFKVPHLRNAYQKVGKFGHTGRFAGSDDEFGDQIKGFGFLHDGSMDTLDNFFKGTVFRFHPDDAINDQQRAQVVDFVMAVDSDFAPIVGQQITLSVNSASDSHERLDLLLERAAITEPRPECDLIAHGVINDQPRGFLYQGEGIFLSDENAQSYTDTQLRDLSQQAGGAITFTCVPPGSGARIANVE